MSTFQTMVSLVLLIFVLSVIVQAVQEFLKSVLSTKANVMEQTIDKFMGNLLTLPQVTAALQTRGLNITALEAMDQIDFRHLLDTIPFSPADEAKLAAAFNNTAMKIDEAKDKIAASYEAARATFQNAYTRKNKIIAVVLSLIVVVLLNANIIILYNQVAADQAAQQTIVGHAPTLSSGSTSADTANLGDAYSKGREQIMSALETNPILLRTKYFPSDFQKGPVMEILGLLVMGLLVSLGAPFWNDVLKGLMGVNNTLNGSKKPS
jgi:hypothetical protein